MPLPEEHHWREWRDESDMFKRHGTPEPWVPRAWGAEESRLLTVAEVGTLSPPEGRPWRTYEQAIAWMEKHG